jgi:hypothetical protein
MTPSLQPQATAAREAVRALERTLASTRPGWDDEKRQSFDQRHADVVVAAGRRLADELTSLAQDLASALASVRNTGLP